MTLAAIELPGSLKSELLNWNWQSIEPTNSRIVMVDEDEDDDDFDDDEDDEDDDDDDLDDDDEILEDDDDDLDDDDDDDVTEGKKSKKKADVEDEWEEVGDVLRCRQPRGFPMHT